MSTLIVIVLFIIVLFFAIFYNVYIVFIDREVKGMRETLYRYQVSLRSCYTVRDMTSLRYNFRKDISIPMGNKNIRFFIPSSYKQEARVIMAIMDERIRLLELSSFPSLKLKENE